MQINKRGSMNLFACGVMLTVLMVFSILLSFAIAINTASSHIRIADQQLDSYTRRNAILIYQQVKEHSDYTSQLLEQDYIDHLTSSQGLVREGVHYISYTDSGSIRYKLSRPQMSFEEDYTAKVSVSYTLNVPLYWSRSVIWVDVPVTVTSRFLPKFE